MARSGGKQIPWESTSLRGNFYFSTKGKDSRFSEEQARLERERRELERLKAEIERKTQQASTEKRTPETIYVSSKRSKKFHLPECKWAKKISPRNRRVFQSRQEAINVALVPCKVCKP